MSCEECELRDDILRNQDLQIKALKLALEMSEKLRPKRLKTLPEIVSDAKKRFREKKFGDAQ